VYTVHQAENPALPGIAFLAFPLSVSVFHSTPLSASLGSFKATMATSEELYAASSGVQKRVAGGVWRGERRTPTSKGIREVVGRFYTQNRQTEQRVCVSPRRKM
jgi:hypothetical protein